VARWHPPNLQLIPYYEVPFLLLFPLFLFRFHLHLNRTPCTPNGRSFGGRSRWTNNTYSHGNPRGVVFPWSHNNLEDPTLKNGDSQAYCRTVLVALRNWGKPVNTDARHKRSSTCSDQRHILGIPQFLEISRPYQRVSIYCVNTNELRPPA